MGVSRPAAWAWSLACVAWLGGCHLLEQQKERGDEDEQRGTDPEKFIERVDYKLRRYAACRDIAASIVSESWDRYSDQVTEEGKPKRAREGVFLRGISSNALRTCERTLATLPQSPPPLSGIEQAARRVVDSARRYAEHTRTLAAYLSEESWHDDDWVLLAEIDPLLRGAHREWAEADAELQAAIDVRHVENDPLLLGVLEQRRGPLEVASRTTMIRARPVVRCMTRTPPPPADECAPLFEAFDAAYAEFEAIYSRDREAADKVFWMETFASDLGEFHAVAAESQRKLGQRRRRAELDLRELGAGYSALVRDAETLDFDFP